MQQAHPMTPRWQVILLLIGMTAVILAVAVFGPGTSR